MKVTPIKKKFGKYAPGEEFELPDKAAKIFIKVGKLQQVHAGGLSYQTRMMQAAAPTVESAPYGYKADGTPRKRPGRPSASE